MERYNAETARHYDAYRPPLHHIILKRALGSGHFDHGLDVGCGTGCSSTALSAWCDQVTAIDPSEQMIQRSEPNPSIAYTVFDGHHIPGESDRFDIITFAGSLFYTDRQQIAREVCRVAKSDGKVLIYDFKILLNDVLEFFEIAERDAKSYRHNINFNGIEIGFLKQISQEHSRIAFHLTFSELAHLLLADDWYYHQLSSKLEHPLHSQLVCRLSEFRSENEMACKATTYFTLYEV